MIPNGDFDQLINYWFPINAATTEMQMYKAGYLLQEIFTRCLNKSESKLTPDRTVWMYFAHDFIMIYVMKALGIYSVTVYFCILNVIYRFNKHVIFVFSINNPRMRHAFFSSYIKERTILSMFRYFINIPPIQIFRRQNFQTAIWNVRCQTYSIYMRIFYHLNHMMMHV